MTKEIRKQVCSKWGDPIGDGLGSLQAKMVNGKLEHIKCSVKTLVTKPTREEIREGLRDILIDFANRKKSLLDAEDLCYLLSDIRAFHHSQGVVIKVDRELPKYWFDRGVDGYTSQHYIPSGLREALEEDGIVAVEPLIKEE